MKYFWLLFFFPLISSAQKGSYLGLSASTGIYKLYNYNDWHSNNFMVPKKTDLLKFSNFSFGLSYNHSYTERNAIEFGFDYLHFRQEYQSEIPPSSSSYSNHWNNLTILEYGALNMNWIHNFIGRNKSEIRPCIYVLGGIRFSYLVNYLDESVQTFSDIYTTHDIQTISNKNGIISNHSEYNGTVVDLTRSSENIFSKFLIGVNVGLGIFKNLSDRINLRAGIHFKYDLNNVENQDAKIFNSAGDQLGNYYFNGKRTLGNVSFTDDPRRSTHNIYYGIEFSLLYNLKRQRY